LGSLITDDVRCTGGIMSRIVITKSALNKKQADIWSIALCSAETCTPGKVAQKYQGSFEMWC
jgi:hypothetical protein